MPEKKNKAVKKENGYTPKVKLNMTFEEAMKKLASQANEKVATPKTN